MIYTEKFCWQYFATNFFSVTEFNLYWEYVSMCVNPLSTSALVMETPTQCEKLLFVSSAFGEKHFDCASWLQNREECGFCREKRFQWRYEQKIAFQTKLAFTLCAINLEIVENCQAKQGHNWAKFLQGNILPSVVGVGTMHPLFQKNLWVSETALDRVLCAVMLKIFLNSSINDYQKNCCYSLKQRYLLIVFCIAFTWNFVTRDVCIAYEYEKSILLDQLNFLIPCGLCWRSFGGKAGLSENQSTRENEKDFWNLKFGRCVLKKISIK